MIEFGKNYARSWMHRETVSHNLFVTPPHSEYGILVTASIDGILKFWQRRPPPEDRNSTDGNTLVLCRTFRVHSSPLTVLRLVGDYVVGGDVDGRVSVVDVLVMEIMGSFRVEGVPESICLHVDVLHVALRDACTVQEYSLSGELLNSEEMPFPIFHLAENNSQLWAFGNSHQIIINNNLLECSDCERLLSVTMGQHYFSLLNEDGILSLYKLKPQNGIKLYRKYDLNFMDEVELVGSAYASLNNVLFDEAEETLLVATGRGIQAISIKESLSVLVAGQAGGMRFVNISLLNAPLKLDVDPDLVFLTPEENPTAAKYFRLRPLLAATAFRKNRFYLFSPEDSDAVDMTNDSDDNDEDEGKGEVFPVLDKDWREVRSAWIRTSKGDLLVEFHAEEAPLAVQNFIHLARAGRFDHVAFHRVVRGFMVQTGDIDGRGGTSAWNRPFPDESTENNNSGSALRHDRKGVLSMANAGKDENGSQFFVTTTDDKCTWLDGKHTIFAQVTKGLDVLAVLGRVETDRRDRPLEQIEILRVDLNKK